MDWDQKIILCGVGGQGILFMARVLYEMGRIQGCDVLGSETHGMSQRGGSVTSHVKIGKYHSPMVRSRTADVLFSLTAEEAYFNLHYLREGGKLLLNAEESFSMNPTVARVLVETGIEVKRVNATRNAIQLGNPLATNLVLLGAGMKINLMPVKYSVLEEAVRAVSPPRFLEGNLNAVQSGFALKIS